MPHACQPQPGILRKNLLSGLAALCLCTLPGRALAGTIVIDFSATISVAFGDLGGQLSGGETVTGTIELDDSVVGVFTPVTVFTRAEMLYSGAIISTSIVVDGNPLSGSGGDVEILDSDGPLNGDDRYETTPVVDIGTVGGIALSGFRFSPAYDDPAFTLTAATPLFGPPPIDPTFANQIQLDSPSGGSAFGSIDTFSVSGAAPVPVLSPLGVGLLVSAVTGFGYARARTMANKESA